VAIPRSGSLLGNTGYVVRRLAREEWPVWDRMMNDLNCPAYFSVSAFADMYARHVGLEFEIVSVFRNGHLIGGMLVFVQASPAGQRRVVVPTFVYYTPVFWDVRHRHLSQELPTHPVYSLIGYLDAQYESAEIWLCPSSTDPRPFSWSGWNVSPRFTYICKLDLPLDHLRIYRKKRTLLKKILGQYHFHQTSNVSMEHIEMMQASFKRHNTEFPLNKTVLHQLLCDLSCRGLISVFTARKEEHGDVDAIAVLMKSNTTALHWIAASIPGNAMRFLLLKLLEHFKREQFSSYDLCGANMASIAFFKYQFAHELVPCYTARNF